MINFRENGYFCEDSEESNLPMKFLDFVSDHGSMSKISIDSASLFSFEDRQRDLKDFSIFGDIESINGQANPKTPWTPEDQMHNKMLSLLEILFKLIIKGDIQNKNYQFDFKKELQSASSGVKFAIFKNKIIRLQLLISSKNFSEGDFPISENLMQRIKAKDANRSSKDDMADNMAAEIMKVYESVFMKDIKVICQGSFKLLLHELNGMAIWNILYQSFKNLCLSS